MLTRYPDRLAPLDLRWDPATTSSPPTPVVELVPNELIVIGTPGAAGGLDALVAALGAEHVALGWPRQEGFSSGRTRWIRAAGTPVDVRNLARQLAQEPAVESVSPVYRRRGGGHDGAITPLGDALLVERDPDAATDAAILADLAARGLTPTFGAGDEVLARRHLTLSRNDDQDVFDLLEEILEQVDAVGSTVELAFDWMCLNGFQAGWSDPLLLEQWHLTRIQAPPAWDAGPRPGPQLRIAVLDGAFDLGHEDLQRPGAAGLASVTTPIQTHFDAYLNRAGAGADMGPDSLNNHATAVTGLLAATLDNGLGCAGVAAGCSVIPVRVDKDHYEFTDGSVARGIVWAVDNGARVINLSGSFAAPVPQTWNAIHYATAADVLICAATGNIWLGPIRPGEPPPGAPEVGFPACHPDVLAVGASDQADRRKTAPDPNAVPAADGSGETWESCYLPPFGGEFELTGVDVVAPGVLTWTTNDRSAHPMKGDMQGPGGRGTPGYFYMGFNYPQAGDPTDLYLECFGGTSAATPQVAGLAGLILASRPDLSAREVRDLIERSCVKVNAGTAANRYVYDEVRRNGSATAEVGYGRIDCARALELAGSEPHPDGVERPQGASRPTSACGFLGRSGSPGVWRLYTTLTLDAFIEIEEAGIHSVVHATSGPGSRVVFDRRAVRRRHGV